MRVSTYCDVLSVFAVADMYLPVIVAAQSKAWTVSARSNTGIVGSNSTQWMSECVYSVMMLFCV
jgi:hypothetical protein